MELVGWESGKEIGTIGAGEKQSEYTVLKNSMKITTFCISLINLRVFVKPDVIFHLLKCIIHLIYL